MVVWTNKYGEWEVGGGPGVVLESRSGVFFFALSERNYIEVVACMKRVVLDRL